MVNEEKTILSHVLFFLVWYKEKKNVAAFRLHRARELFSKLAAGYYGTAGFSCVNLIDFFDTTVL